MLTLFFALALALTEITDSRTIDQPATYDQLTLRAGADVRLRADISVETMTIDQGASLTISDPVTITFADAPIDTGADPEQLSHGLICRGRLRVTGQAKTAHAEMAEAAAGERQLSLTEAPEGWAFGDKLYIPDTRQPIDSRNPASGALHHETRTIAAIDGRRITLDRPLAYAHSACRTPAGTIVGQPRVANLSRSIVFRSANPSGVRGHIYLTERADIHIRHAAFLDLGRTTGAPLDSTILDARGQATRIGTNQKGRYALHLHHLMGPMTPAGPQYTIDGNVIMSDNPLSRWGITVHQSHYGLVKDNVVICCAGAGIVTEDGPETGNTIEGNYVAHVTGEGRPDARATEVGFEGSAYWFRGGDNTIRVNHAYSAKDGYVFYARFARPMLRPSAPGLMPDVPIDPVRTPLAYFVNNSAWGCQIGFSAWWLGVDYREPIDSIGESTVKWMSLYHCRNGVSSYETGRFRYLQCGIFGDPAKAGSGSGGWGASDYLQWRTTIDGGYILGCGRGITTGSICDRLGASGTNPGLFVVRDTKVQCATNLTVPLPWHNASAKGLPPITCHLDGVEFAAFGKQQIHIRMLPRASEYTAYTPWSTCWFHAVGVGEDPGWHLRFWGANQAAGSVLPASSADGRIQGAPVALPNANAWRTYGLATGGELMPDDLLGFGVIDGTIQWVEPGPTLAPLPDLVLGPGDALRLPVYCYDPSLGEMDYRLVAGPPGAAIANRSGTVTWSPATEGTYALIVEAVDVDQPTLRTRRECMVVVRRPSS